MNVRYAYAEGCLRVSLTGELGHHEAISLMGRLAALVEEKGYTYFDWNVDSKDAGGATTPEEVLSNVIEGVGTKSHSVVLMHDIKSYTVDAVEWIIRWGKSCGYTFAVLTPDGPTCHHVINN